MVWNNAHTIGLESIDPELIEAARADLRGHVDVHGEPLPVGARVVPSGHEPQPSGIDAPQKECVKENDPKQPTPQTTPPGCSIDSSRPEQFTKDSLAKKLAENRLRELAPYLDVNHGMVTFSRIPQHLRTTDGRHCRRLLEEAGIIDSRLNLTAMGRNWLQQGEQNSAWSLEPPTPQTVSSPFEEYLGTQEGFDATERYVLELRKMPPEDFDLKTWYRALIGKRP